MGCDIHFFVEKKVNGSWLPTTGFETLGGYDECIGIPFGERWYTDRNYDFFAILADVRNGYGFAGIDTGDGFKPISLPRGLPEDINPTHKQIADQWRDDAHSHSWLSFQELFEFDWTQTAKKRGWVNFESYCRWTCSNYFGRAANESPVSYCGGISGPNIHHVTNEEMDALVDARSHIPRSQFEEFNQKHASYYTKVEWDIPYFRAASDFWSEVVPRLFHLAAQPETEGLRIVFFFDN